MISRRAILSALLPLCLAAPAMAQLIPSPALAPIGKLDGLFAPGATFDFSQAGTLPAGATFTRASTAWSFNSSPSLASAANNVPRWPYDPTTAALRGLFNEAAATNILRNSSGTGATGAATTPTNWATGGSLNGITRTFTQVSEDGIPAVDIKFVGTPTATSGSAAYFELAGTNPAAALAGQDWIGSFYIRLSTGSLTNVAFINLVVRDCDAAGGILSDLTQQVIAPTAAALRTQRIDLPRPITNPLTAKITAYVSVNYTNGLPVDFTLRVFPNLVQALAPSSPIVTTAGAVTRAADVLTLPVANGTYSVDITTDVDTTTLLNQVVSGGAYVVPNGPAPLRSVSFR